ncbi:RAM signaling network component [Agyrium rufum]|nr:RAM signaling network component [Agyrium rufum]
MTVKEPSDGTDGTDSTDGWDEISDSFQGFRSISQPFNPGKSTSDYDYATLLEDPSPKSLRLEEPAVSTVQTIEIVQDAVDAARSSLPQVSNGESVGETLRLNLTVDLARRQISTLPDQAIEILRRDAERIVLSHNHLSKIPSSLSECTALTYLNLRGNRFHEFPNAVYKLPHLQILDLSRNTLYRVPEEIKEMKSLRVLSVMSNRLQNIPFCIGFMDTLTVVKLASNPLNEGLRRVLDGQDTSPSPLTAPLAESEHDARMTSKLKKYLRDEAAALESGGDSSSESPLETPRPLKRNNSIRFPVVPSASGSESARDLRSPSSSRPPSAQRNHFRVASGQSPLLQSFSNRRPGIAPLIIGNERNRSNSESILQATQNIRNKRMGMVSKKSSDLGTVDESRRNSIHFRGMSHASALREKPINSLLNSHASTPFGGTPHDTADHPGVFVRRLSSLPEHKRSSTTPNHFVEAAKSLLYSLHQVHPHMASLIRGLKGGVSKRASLEKAYHTTSTHLERLDKELHELENSEDFDDGATARGFANISQTCQSCIASYRQICTLITAVVPHLIATVDPRYIRTLFLLVYGSLCEVRICSASLARCLDGPEVRNMEHPTISVTTDDSASESQRSSTSTKMRPAPLRRFRSDRSLQQIRTNNLHHHISNSGPQSAVPLYINGRSRSNSRIGNLTASCANSNSMANTPRSGESFYVPETPVEIPETDDLLESNARENEQDVIFEKIYLDFKDSLENGLQVVPQLLRQCKRRYEEARHKDAARSVLDLLARLITRCQHYIDMCEHLKERLSRIKVRDPEARGSTEFWSLCVRYANSFIKLVDDIKTQKQYALLSPDVGRMLQPVHKSIKAGIADIKLSPWAFVLSHNSRQTQETHSAWEETQRGNNSGHHHRFISSQQRSRAGSSSSSSHYGPSVPATSIPATPLFAALGPAAQATIPTTPLFAAHHDTNGAVDHYVDHYQRSGSPLHSMQNTMLHRR